MDCLVADSEATTIGQMRQLTVGRCNNSQKVLSIGTSGQELRFDQKGEIFQFHTVYLKRSSPISPVPSAFERGRL
jgi:hypothetical protein